MEPLVNMQVLRERVLVLRRRAGLSQMALADQAGIDLMTVSRVESGRKKRLDLETAARLAHVFGMPLDQLCGLAAPTADRASPAGTTGDLEPDATDARVA